MNAQLFNEKIQELNHNLEDLGTRCAEAFNNALIALAEGDMERCRAIVAADDAIDERHMALHHECLSFLAEDNPIAVDLRFVGAALQIATDIERIGDHAVEIAYAVMAIGTDRAEATPAPLLTLANRTRTQLEAALRAFHERDLALARRTGAADAIVDHLYDEAIKALTANILSRPGFVGDGIHLVRVADALERVGDHAANICEWAAYLVAGDLARLNRHPTPPRLGPH